MNIDPNLIRELLLELEKRPYGSSPIIINRFGNYEQFKVDKHLQYLNSLEYISGEPVQGSFAPAYLTEKGRMYLDEIRETSIIIKYLKKISKFLISFITNHTGEFIAALLTALVLTYLGLR